MAKPAKIGATPYRALSRQQPPAPALRALQEAAGPASEGASKHGLSAIDDDRSGAVTRIVRAERRILLLRGFEQRSNQETATELGLLPDTVAVTYRRALEKLGRKLPESIFVELREGDR